jgi:hypothetical protein
MASPVVSTNRDNISVFSRTESGEVIFDYSGPFDRKTNEYDSFYAIFPKDQYEKALEDLAIINYCRLSTNGTTLEINCVEDRFQVILNTPGKILVLPKLTSLEGFL